MTNRRTSIYVLTTSLEPTEAIERLRWMQGEVSAAESVGGTVDNGDIRFGFRAANDHAALEAAAHLAVGLEFRLYTGLGVNRREVTRDAMQSGDRIVLIKCTDPYTRLKPGATGTVNHIDAVDTVHVDWDDGHTLGLIAGEDQWRKIESPPRPDPNTSIVHQQHNANVGKARWR